MADGLNFGILDPSIIRPRPNALAGLSDAATNYNNMLAKKQQMDQAKQEYQFNQLKMQDYQKTRADEDAQNAIYAGAINPDTGVIDYSKLNAGMASGGFGTKIPAINKQRLEQQNAQIDQATKTNALIKITSSNVMSNPTLANALENLNHIQSITGVDMSGDKAQVSALGDDPVKIKAWAIAHAVDADKLLAKSGQRDIGGSLQDTMIDPITGAVTVTGTTAKTISPNTTATINAQATQGNLNRQNAKDVAKLRNSGDLTPEQNDALYGVNGAVTLGKLDPYKINSRNSHILANAYMGNPNMDMNKLASDSAMMRNAPTMNRAYTTEQLPTIIANVVEAGKKVGYSDAKFFGKVQEFINGQSNDPNFINYMTQRNDALLTITSIMRGNGATDQAHRAEIEASPSTMSPKAFDAWAAGQMKALEPRIKQANKFTRSASAAPANAPTGIDVNAIDAELARRGHK